MLMDKTCAQLESGALGNNVGMGPGFAEHSGSRQSCAWQRARRRVEIRVLAEWRLRVSVPAFAARGWRLSVSRRPVPTRMSLQGRAVAFLGAVPSNFVVFCDIVRPHC